MAHALHDLGEARLLGVMHNSGYPNGIGGASVLNHYYGHDDDVRLGAYKGMFGHDKESSGHRAWRSGPYVPALVRDYAAPIKSSADVPDAVALYRTLLAAASDRSVAIAAIGFVRSQDHKASSLRFCASERPAFEFSWEYRCRLPTSTVFSAPPPTQ